MVPGVGQTASAPNVEPFDHTSPLFSRACQRFASCLSSNLVRCAFALVPRSPAACKPGCMRVPPRRSFSQEEKQRSGWIQNAPTLTTASPQHPTLHSACLVLWLPLAFADFVLLLHAHVDLHRHPSTGTQRLSNNDLRPRAPPVSFSSIRADSASSLVRLSTSRVTASCKAPQSCFLSNLG